MSARPRSWASWMRGGARAFLLLGAAALLEGAALADPAVTAEVDVLFDEGGVVEPGALEIVAEIQNSGGAAVTGKLEMAVETGTAPYARYEAAFTAAAGARTRVRLPAFLEHSALVTVRTGDGQDLAPPMTLSATESRALRIVDLSPTPRIGPAVDRFDVWLDPNEAYDLSVPPVGGAPSFSKSPSMKPGGPPPPFHAPGPYSAPNSVSVRVLGPSNGGSSLALPIHGAAYQKVNLVFAPSSVWVGLPADERTALSTFVLGGGTLAIAIDRPEDLGHPALTSLTGEGVAAAAPTETLLGDVLLPVRPSAATSRLQGERRETLKLTSFQGGNLTSSAFGAEAPYGLGQVVLLGFNPASEFDGSDPWVHRRLLELARQSYLRSGLATTGFGEGRGEPFGDAYSQVRALLDPNGSVRWGALAAALFLCIYALVIGPWLHGRARKQNDPFMPLRRVPLFSAGAFLVVYLLGFIGRSPQPTSSRLTFVDLGAGMETGAARMYRAFFSMERQAIDATQNSSSSLLTAASPNGRPAYIQEKGAQRISGVLTEPSQVFVLRDDGPVTLSGSLDIRELGAGEIVFENQFEKALTSMLIRLPDGSYHYAAKLAGKASISSRDLEPAPPPFTGLAPGAFDPLFPSDMDISNGFSEKGAQPTALAVTAVAQPLLERHSLRWFPAGTVSVLAELEGGTGAPRDSGVQVKVDRVMIRVVGFGAHR